MTAQTQTTSEARWDAARERATEQGVRLQVVEVEQHYRTMSQSQDDTVYEIRRYRTGWTCTCPGHQFTGVCKHVAAVEQRAAREGWEFAGKPAPTNDDEIRELAASLFRKK